MPRKPNLDIARENNKLAPFELLRLSIAGMNNYQRSKFRQVLGSRLVELIGEAAREAKGMASTGNPRSGSTGSP